MAMSFDCMHARYYFSVLGRFLSVDPIGGEIGSSQSRNRYSYVRNNPLNFIDPTGMIGKALTDEARAEILSVAGDDSAAVTFSDDGTFTVSASGEQMAANEGLAWLNEIATSDKTIGLVVGSSVESNEGPISLVGGEIENLSTTPDHRPGTQRLPSAGYDGMVGIGSDAAAVRTEYTENGRPAHLTSIVFHELVENYMKTVGRQQYSEAHRGAQAVELILRSQRPGLERFASAGAVFLLDQTGN